MKKSSLKYFISSLFFVLVLSACNAGGTQDIILLENADPENCTLEICYFDGEKTEIKWLCDDEEAEKVIEEINSLKTKAMDSSKIEEFKIPCYGLGICNKDGEEMNLTYSDGLWLLKDGSVYQAKYDIKKLYDKVSDEDDMNSYDGGILFPNAALLGKYDNRFYRKSEDLPSEKNGVSLSFVSLEDNRVTVSIKNDSDGYFSYGEYYTLQKKIDGEWYTLPCVKEWAFYDVLLEIPAGVKTEEICDLTPYGTLEKGTYRIEKEGLVAEFEIQ